MSRLHTRPRSIAFATIVALVTGSAVAVGSNSPRISLLLALTLVVPLPVVVRGLQKRFDPFEPIFVIALSAFVLFVLHPGARLVYDDMLFRGYGLESGFDSALVLALFGVVALYAGYAASTGRKAALRLPAPPDRWDSHTMTAVSVGLIVLGSLLYVGFLVQAGGLSVVGALLAGRSSTQGLIFANGSAYLYFGPFLIVPATLLLLENAAYTRRIVLLLLAGLTSLTLAVITVPRGDRMLLLTLFGGILVLPYLRRQRRPRLTLVLLVGLAIWVFGVSLLAETRTTETRQARFTEAVADKAAHPFSGVRQFLTGPQTEMFPVLALMTDAIPTRLDHHPLVTVESLVANPVPDFLFPNKPQTGDIEVYTALFPEQAAVTRAGTASSVFGGFYYDSGLPGVVVGALLVGFALRLMYEYLLANPTNAAVRLGYAASLPLTIILFRGNPTDTLARASYLVLPLILAVWLSSARARSSSRYQRPRVPGPLAPRSHIS